MKWSEHIDYIYNKLVKFVGIFYKLRNKLPIAILRRDGKNHDFFKKIENIEKIENIGYFRYISDFFDIYPIHI